MNPTNLLLDIFDACIKIYSVICRRPHVTARVQFTPQRDRSGEVTKELMALTIINESSPEVDVQEVWFLTSFKRPVSSTHIDAKLPVKVRGRDRTTYFVPFEDLKAALNKNVAETIAEVVILDKTGRKHIGRVGRAAAAEFAS